MFNITPHVRHPLSIMVSYRFQSSVSNSPRLECLSVVKLYSRKGLCKLIQLCLKWFGQTFYQEVTGMLSFVLYWITWRLAIDQRLSSGVMIYCCWLVVIRINSGEEEDGSRDIYVDRRLMKKAPISKPSECNLALVKLYSNKRDIDSNRKLVNSWFTWKTWW